jgi:dTDP-4-amino-4,6-dideoxygalactose transaminase
VGRAEARLSAMHEGRPALLMPSATFGMLSVLGALGIGPGDEVLIPGLDWTATYAAVLALGATPVPAPVTPSTWTINPAAAARLRTARTRAVVACHLLGTPADVPGLRAALPGLPIVEDCAQAFGSRLDGRAVGTLGDAAVFSFGPGKWPIDAGEAGAVVVADGALREAVLRRSAHPVRQKLGGVVDVNMASFGIRVHPLAAVLLAVALESLDVDVLIASHEALVARLPDLAVLPLLGDDARRESTAPYVAADAAALLGESSPAGVTIRYGDVQDIGALAEGSPRTRAVAFLAATGSGARGELLR